MDGHLRQNPAYRPATEKALVTGLFLWTRFAGDSSGSPRGGRDCGLRGTARPGLLRLMEESPTGRVALEGQIVGGGPRRDGIGFLGVFLDHDPADFGLALQRAANGRSLRTGFSDAMVTDLDDDKYDLSWYGELSENDVTAIKQLRSTSSTLPAGSTTPRWTRSGPRWSTSSASSR